MRNKNTYIGIFIVAFMLQGCDYFKFDFGGSPTEDIVARVNDSYLYKEDIESLISESTTKEDSTVIVNNYIDRWATQQLLTDRAKLNLNLERQKKFDKLVEDYKNQLYTKAYSDALVIKQLDSVITENQIEAYYEQNQETFSLNERLYKLRFVLLDPSNSYSPSKIKRELIRFNEDDKIELNKKFPTSKNANLNDSIWRTKNNLLSSDLTVLNKAKTWEIDTPERFVQLQDSLGVYMIYIKDIKKRGEQAPLSYVKGTVEQIILNKRKQELIKQLRTDITKDAIKNNEFEIYK